MVHRIRESAREQNIRIGQIVPVSEFNSLAEQDWHSAVGDFEFGKGGFPALSMYQFINQNTGSPKKVGFVGRTSRDGWIWGRTKREVMQRMLRRN
jgi:hypothetical protein